MERIALIVVDMQNRFKDGGKCILENITKLITFFHENNCPVFFTQHQDPDPESLINKRWNLPITFGKKDWKLMKEIEEQIDLENDVRIDEKTTYDSFYKTPLKEKLDNKSVDTVVVCGVMTHLCCETTARSAFIRNFNVLFVSDANWTSSEKFQKATLRTLGHGFAEIIQTNQFIKSKKKENSKKKEK
ncbi:peroxyureidoacrylate/ureidoacrylate amidohydrolase-related [Anaeramoeba flamelloides]|uniref:Peroxyureidoacrylate/ureidoacrylate amidohydrolase-related n=1 Tax=Anaeramoeba flamelloides TaxID=1746091 RepID=A0AAV7YLW0_9EUKA|nr:peroxyureidoacrylate/ureidoacrylate amidohydrolase-related [Anaeramoeba flamelloides]